MALRCALLFPPAKRSCPTASWNDGSTDISGPLGFPTFSQLSVASSLCTGQATPRRIPLPVVEDRTLHPLTAVTLYLVQCIHTGDPVKAAYK